ncbi:cation channel family protein [Chrysochromulina tobinii]|uniref:Cation channel family protein n=1 Tax=Chrysochromulina tobinii TaxID=1460289 RepID=A0A0M0J7S2_9EUKA|nr:cation channel family protein [Chrysochromulina tobinii]|eukprot:KOO22278.1 cation channel family protein [Chrysochromulina sp. CCMP291]
MVPLRVCFSLRSCIFSADWTWELFVDCCFFADILLTFRTALILDDPEKQERKVVTDARRIAYHYIKGWFVIDVVSTIPIDTIIELTLYASTSAAEAQSLRTCSFLTESPEDSNLRSTMMLRVMRLVRLVRLLKLFRTLKLGLLFRRLDDAVNINPAVFKMARLLAYILLLSHLSACSWFGIFKQVVEEGSEPVADNWIEAYASAQLVPKLADAIRGDMLTQYTSALYWAFTTLTTVGYGDIVPKNVSEMWFVILMEFVGLIVFSIAIAQLTNIMDNFSAQKKLLSALMAEVTRYMRERKMTPRMQRRVLRFYEYYLERVSVFDVNLMLSEVSQSLKYDICEEDEMRQRQELARSWVLHPGSPYKNAWDACLAVLVVYSVVVVPLRIGFNEEATPRSAIFWFEVSIDFIFIIDIVVNCRTAYLTAHGLLEKRPRQIARHYLLSWFVADVAASIPVDLILLANQAFAEGDGSEERDSYRMTKLIKALRLLRLFRLVRLVKLARLIKIVQEKLQINPFVLQLVKLCFKMSFLIHLSACAWHWSAAFDLPEYSPFACQARAAAGQQTCFDERVTMAMATWLQYFEASHFSNGEWPTTLEAYTASIYWAMTTVATIGYGDIKSISNLERLMSIVIMLSGSIVFGVVVGGMSDSLEQMNSVRARRTRKKDYVKAMLRERNVPHALIIRTKQYYERYLLECGDVVTEQKILSELPPPLRTELLLCLNLRTVESIAFFHGQDSTFIISVCKMLKPCYFAPLDWIFKEGDLGLEMYFVQLGSVDVICFLDGEEVILETLEAGAYFGEVAVMMDDVRREASVRAVSFCSMFSFTKENLNRLLQMYPDVMKKMQTQMERRLRQYRLKRSIQNVKSANAVKSANTLSGRARPR